MLTAVEETIAALSDVVQEAPIGTNISLLRIMWAMVNGSFLKSRGSVHGALAESGFADEEIARGSSGLRSGSWEIDELLSSWHLQIGIKEEWRAKKIENYKAKGVDITGFWRPKLKGETSKLYNSASGRAEPAVIVGVVTTAGEINGKRVPKLDTIVRWDVGKSQSEFHSELLRLVKKSMLPDEGVVIDAGFSTDELLESGIPRFALRSASNCTARRNTLPDPKELGRPAEYGEIVRPLARTYKGNEIAATKADTDGKFVYQKRTIKYEAWHDLVTTSTKVDRNNGTFSIYVFDDPHYQKPMVITIHMSLSPKSIYLFYKERWPVEHPPLVAKQMIGLHRQFVFNDEACFRLPELGLLAGNILSHLAALLPPMPSGYWDREPLATPGRLRRALSRATFPNLDELDSEIRKKESVSAHLPKGILGHRRTKAAA